MIKYIILIIVILIIVLLEISSGYSCGIRQVEILNRNDFDEIVYFDHLIDNQEINKETFDMGNKLFKNKSIKLSMCAKTIWFYDIEIWRRKVFPKTVQIMGKRGNEYSFAKITISLNAHSCIIPVK